MEKVKKVLKVRTAIKKRKPTFKRVQSHQFKKLSETKWRKPKGMGNKVRRNRRGKPGTLQVGYKSPKLIRGFNKDGFKEVIVANVSDLKLIEKDLVGVISSKVGAKKKLSILNEAKKKNIQISNFKNLDLSIKKFTQIKKESKNKKVDLKKGNKKEVEKTTEPKNVDSKEEIKKIDLKETKENVSKETKK